MQVEIIVDYKYGGWANIEFKKKIDIPGVPFTGLIILESDDDMDMDIRLEEYCNHFESKRTEITWDVQENEYCVLIETRWKKPVRNEVIDQYLEIFNHFGWDRTDRTNIDDMKRLMKD